MFDDFNLGVGRSDSPGCPSCRPAPHRWTCPRRPRSWAGHYVWLAMAWGRWARVRAGYLVRPYDTVLDARRWRWQPAGMCGRRVAATLPPELRAQIVEGVQQAHVRRVRDDPRG